MEKKKFEDYDGESKKCLIKYGDTEIEIGYTLMHKLVSHIDIRGMTYGAELGVLSDVLADIRNHMGADADDELERSLKAKD